MEILSVTLKNFKSHSDRHVEFQLGTNAICGENGAGKTSILEAIAWTLFNYRGNYKNEDFIRNGSGSAQVTVAFVSSRDQRTYHVSRCTRSGYTIYDPQLGEKLDYSRIEEEILPWLRQQLGVSPGTDLADLFANTIGVPQGMFTADFLKPERERKKTFDSILKVEEYRKTHDNLLPLSKHAESAVAELVRDIARYDEELEALATLQQKRQVQAEEIDQVQARLQQVTATVDSLQQEQATLTSQATEIHRLETAIDHLQTRLQDQTHLVQRLTADVQQAEQATAICTANRAAYQAVLDAEKILLNLEKQRRQETQLRQKRQTLWEELSDRQTRLATLTHQLQRLQAHAATLQQLTPLMQEQETLEQQQQQLQQQLQALDASRKSLAEQQRRQQQVQTRLAELQAEIDRLQQLQPLVQQIPTQEADLDQLQQQLGRVTIATQFEADLRQLANLVQTASSHYHPPLAEALVTLADLHETMPLWAEALNKIQRALETGQAWQQKLTIALNERLEALAQQTRVSQLEQQIQAIQTQLQTARQCQAQLATLAGCVKEQHLLTQELEALTNRLTQLKTELEQQSPLKQELAQVSQALADLNDPRGQCRLLKQELQEQLTLEASITELKGSLAAGQAQIADLEQQLQKFATLTQAVEQEQICREHHRPAYEEYLRYRELANTRRDRQAQLDAALTQMQTLTQELQQLQANCAHLKQDFDSEHFQTVQVAFQSATAEQIALTARLPDMVKYLTELDTQLTRLETIQTQRCQAEQDLEQRRKVDHFIKFARKTYKAAGPRITERYVQTISREADRLLRELLNRPNVALEWSRDYEIKVQEGSYKRRFVNLSGGEQMCAALAVRLALLKVLADIDVAFFDEPTTNMDRPRRQHLATAIANIKTFRQLFVISHDDTFEQITENIIQIEREPA
ncbi:MAG TPA: SMC family ATPase [Coleofasciculaceae cyanobacterium]